MTKQIDDTIEFDHKNFVICNSGYAHLVEPKDYGMKATHCGTALHRGYYAAYSIENQRLILENFSICTDEYFPIKGHISSSDKLSRKMRHYHNLRIPIKCTGNLYVGCQPISWSTFEPISYKIIKGLHFEDGYLTNVVDYSKPSNCLRLFMFLRKFFSTTNVEIQYNIISKYIPLYKYGYDEIIKSVMSKSTVVNI